MFSTGCYACANFLDISPPTKYYNVSPYLPITSTKGTFQNPILSFHSPLAYPITNSKLQSFRVYAADNPSTKTGSIVCKDCDGNGIILCSQCKGNGVNSVDHFNGQFKAGGLCWLCRGKREILCGNCNGAGFIGGFMSTFDE